MDTITLAADAGYSSAQFGTDILGAAQSVLPYIGAAVPAGLLIMALIWGISKGLKTVRTVGK